MPKPQNSPDQINRKLLDKAAEKKAPPPPPKKGR